MSQPGQSPIQIPSTNPATNPETLATHLLPWYEAHHRFDLPWRQPGTTAWGVLVCEIMSQQTPVNRVAPAWEAWMERWPTPADVAAATGEEILLMWGRLGYPRRAMRLRDCARTIVADHNNTVPSVLDELLELPGIGTYTAAAVAVFAYGKRHPVVDTNVRRVVARLAGRPDAGKATTPADLSATEALLPHQPERAAAVSIALMELGALLCKARTADCAQCPLQPVCGFAFQEIPAGPSRKRQRYEGTNRHVRGTVIQQLREADGALARGKIDIGWAGSAQINDAIAQLESEGLIETDAEGRWRLPIS